MTIILLRSAVSSLYVRNATADSEGMTPFSAQELADQSAALDKLAEVSNRLMGLFESGCFLVY